MTERVLTTGSLARCDHGAPSRLALASGQSRLLVEGASVLVAGDLPGTTVGGCPHSTDNSGNKTCTSVATRTGGTSGKLRVEGAPVLLVSASGETDGVDAVGDTSGPSSWSVSRAQHARIEVD